MDPVRNPYSPGAGIRPRELAGRDVELERFDVLRHRTTEGLAGRSIVMTGLRGVGKTVLLNELADRARKDGWLVAKVEADSQGRPFREQLARAFNRELRELTRPRTLAARARRALSTFRAFSLKTDPSGSMTIGIELDHEAGRGDTGALDVDLTDLALDLSDAAADRSAGVVVLIDEMQDLGEEELAAVCAVCHEASQRGAQFYVVGAGLPSLPRVLAEAKSYAERLFEYWPIGALNSIDAAIALVEPANQVGISWERTGVIDVIHSSSGYPYFLQEFGKAAWDYATGPDEIAAHEAAMGVRVGTKSLDGGFFRSRWDRATPGEREYLRAMAQDGEGPSASGVVAKRLGKDSRAVGPVRANLIHKGLVYAPEHGLIAFTVPMMAQFIDRQPRDEP
jgi:hypothetical protein